MPKTDLSAGTTLQEPLSAAVDTLADQPDRWPAQLAALTGYLRAEAEAAGLDPALARRLACRQAARWAHEYGGGLFYVPKPDSLERALRDLAIWADHDGTVEGANGIRRLARRYKLSEKQIYLILATQRELNRRRQPLGAPPPSGPDSNQG